MKRIIAIVLLCCNTIPGFCWGFYAHQRINYYAVFLLPPEMMALFKPNILFLSDHAVDPDKRRYAVAAEGARHYIDLDFYGSYPYKELPHKWVDAVKKYSEDTLVSNGIVPWHIIAMEQRLTDAFKEKDQSKILKYAAELGHYVSDSHVPLHASSNHDGQLTNQKGIHAFWEGRVPELLAAKEFDFLIGKARYIEDVPAYVWKKVLESGAASQEVLTTEAALTKEFPPDQKYAFEDRNGKLVRQYSSAFTTAYHKALHNMVEKRMQESILSVASLWVTAWINAGQPDLKTLSNTKFSEADLREFETLNNAWKTNPLQNGEHD